MTLLNPSELEQLHTLLTCRQGELRADLHAAGQAQRERTDTSLHEVTDRKDDAAQRQSAALDGVQEQRDIDEMAQVEAALQRLDAGIYGSCADCGEPIALPRLRVQPAALRCAACQTRNEGALGTSRTSGASGV